ncbi:MAG: hypothetical protein U0169_26240 [Polyangiaceae bacterium]
MARRRAFSDGRTFRRCAAACALATASFAPSPVFAAPQADARPAPDRTRVDIEVVSERGSDADLDASLDELVKRLGLVPRFVHAVPKDPGDGDTQLARVSVRVQANGAADVTVTDASGTTVASRRVERDGARSLTNEEIAHVVQGSVEPLLLAERDRRARPPEPPKPKDEPKRPVEPPPSAVAIVPEARDAAPARKSASPWAFDLATQFGGAFFSQSSGPTARVGGAARVAWRKGVRPALVVTGQYLAPFEVGDSLVSVDVRGGSFRVLPTLELVTTSHVGLDLSAGLGSDVFTVQPQSDQLPSNRIGNATTRADVVATGLATFHVALTSNTTVDLSFGVDADFAERRWQAAAGPTRSTVFAPWRVRPTALLGFSFTALGPGRTESR